MILKLSRINAISGNMESGRMALEVSCSCTDSQLLDNIAVIWERVEDETLIAHLLTLGYELRKLSE